MEQLTGNEEFVLQGTGIGIYIRDFWNWAYSDLLNNTYRGVMAEFLVYSAINSITSLDTQIRTSWLPFDVTSPSGRRIEVRSTAYVQSWTTDFPSQISYDIAPKLAWDGKTMLQRQNATVTCMCSASILLFHVISPS